MGNTIVIEDVQQGSSPSIGGIGKDMEALKKMEKVCAPRPLLQRKCSSFLEEPITSKLTERGEVDVTLGHDENDNGRSKNKPQQLLRYAVSEMQGWRSHMEDKHALNPTLSSNSKQAKLLKDHHVFAVFDGHGGDFASNFCGAHFVDTLTSQKDWTRYLMLSSATKRRSVAGLQLLKSALTCAFLELDEKLMKAQQKQRLHQLSMLEDLVSRMGGNMEKKDVFKKGTRDHERIMDFDKILPESIPAGVPLERSGSTGVVVLVTPNHIICANAGDSRAILSKNKNEVLPLSFDHKPCNDVEMTRVYNDGGFIRAGRVDGDLAVARSFGDFGYKNGLLNEKNNATAAAMSATDGSSSMLPSTQSIRTVSTWLSSINTTAEHPKDHRVTVHPDILVHTREPAKDEFILLACDGIWDRLSNKDCSDLVRTLVHQGETDVGLICEEMIDTALEMDSRDNMTCLLVVFPGANMGTQHVGSHRMGVLKRRRNREQSWGSDSSPAKRAQQRLEERSRKRREAIAKASSKNLPLKEKRQKSHVVTYSSKRASGGDPASAATSSGTIVSSTAKSSSVTSSVLATSHHGKGKKNKASTLPPSNGSGRVRNIKSLRIQMSSSSQEDSARQ